jgi:hypothetical protein
MRWWRHVSRPRRHLWRRRCRTRWRRERTAWCTRREVVPYRCPSMRKGCTHGRASIRAIRAEPCVWTCAKIATTPALFDSSRLCSNDTLCLVRPGNDLSDFGTNFDCPASADPYTPDHANAPTILVSLFERYASEKYPCTESTAVQK